MITSFLHEIQHVLSVTGIWYWKNSVPDCMTDATETGTIFPVTVFGTGFWYVCHGITVVTLMSSVGRYQRLDATISIAKKYRDTR